MVWWMMKTVICYLDMLPPPGSLGNLKSKKSLVINFYMLRYRTSHFRWNKHICKQTRKCTHIRSDLHECIITRKLRLVLKVNLLPYESNLPRVRLSGINMVAIVLLLASIWLKISSSKYPQLILPSINHNQHTLCLQGSKATNLHHILHTSK